MIRALLILLALTAGGPAGTAAQSRMEARDAPTGIWTRADGRIRFTAGRISFPENPGGLAPTQFSETSSHGRGLDNSILFRSSDQELLATVYVYAPRLPHAGLSAYATDTFMRALPSLSPRRTGMRVTAAGGQENAAIRIDYANYRGNLASTAAFLKVDRWIVKLRVSGPESRRADVERTMTALLDGLRFEGTVRARPPEMLDPDACPETSIPRATLHASTEADTGSEAITGTGLVESDEHARERDGAALLTPRFGDRWCLSTQARFGEVSYPILRSLMPVDGERMRSVAVVPLSDAGRAMEVVEMPRRHRFVVFYHEIGKTELLGAFDSMPTDEQIANLISGADRAGARVRAVVEQAADGNSTVTIIRPVSTPAPATPAGTRPTT